MKSIRIVVGATLAAAVLSGCDVQKSANPTSPSVAGPIPGVSITTPKLLEPGQSWTISKEKQPITLLIENASTTGERALTYNFEIATDAEFSTKVFTREAVAPGEGGRTALQLPDALASDRTYYWRAQAVDGANSGSYSAASPFSVYTPAQISVPTLLEPIGDRQTSSRQPSFAVRNADRSGPVGSIHYVFEISANSSFTAMLAIVTIPEATTTTRFTLAQALAYSTRFFWRVRAYDAQTSSDWSPTQSFITPDEPVYVPTPTPDKGKWPSDGPSLISYIEDKYPSRLAPTSTLDQRLANTEYLRDRLIEAGICGGMQLALNLKRGGPEISIDFVAYKKNGTWVGVDFASASKVYGSTMSLYWGEVGSSGVYPKTYPTTPSCN